MRQDLAAKNGFTLQLWPRKDCRWTGRTWVRDWRRRHPEEPSLSIGIERAPDEGVRQARHHQGETPLQLW